MAALTLSAPDVRTAKRLVVKIGSALLVDRRTGLKQNWLSALALDVAQPALSRQVRRMISAASSTSPSSKKRSAVA